MGFALYARPLRPAVALALTLMWSLPAPAQTLSGAPGAVATGATVWRSLADRAADAYNVKDFGCLGNGADQTRCFQTADDAAAAAGGKLIEVPAGTWTLSGTIVGSGSNTWLLLPGATLTGAGGLAATGAPLTLASGTLSIAHAKAYGSGALVPFLVANETVSGRPTTTASAASLNDINAVDNLDASGLGGAANLMYFLDVPGTAAKGQRAAVQTQIALDNTTADGANGNFYVGLNAAATAAANQGGTASAASANLVAGTLTTKLAQGATYFGLVEGFEGGVEIDAGASAAFVNGGKLSPGGCGSLTCSGLAFGGWPTDAGRFSVVIDLNAQEMASNQQSVQTGGTLIGAHYPNGGSTPINAGNGVDLTKYAFSGNAFASTGFSVDGAGNVAASNLSPCPVGWIAGGSGCVATRTAANSAALQWTGLAAGNKVYRLVCRGITPASASRLELQFGEGTGPTWETSGYYGNAISSNHNSATVANVPNSNGAAIFLTGGNILGSGPWALQGDYTIVVDSTSLVHSAQGLTSYEDSGSNYSLSTINGAYAGDTNAITALEVLLTTGNITSGACDLYWLR